MGSGEGAGDRESYPRASRDRSVGSVDARQIEVPEVTAMPRSIQDILDHADELAERFEEYEPGEGDERRVEEDLLERAALTRARSVRSLTPSLQLGRLGSPGARTEKPSVLRRRLLSSGTARSSSRCDSIARDDAMGTNAQ